MARLAMGRQRLSPGCFYTMKPGKGMAINIALTISWYAWPFLMWNIVRKQYSVKWYQYPWLIGVIAKYTILKLVGK